MHKQSIREMQEETDRLWSDTAKKNRRTLLLLKLTVIFNAITIISSICTILRVWLRHR
jgi:hypothetical protein